MGTIWLSNTNGCWIDVWDKKNFEGNHQRLYGPIDMALLRLGESDWSSKLMSLRTGPSAYLECFEDLNIPHSIYWLMPNQEVANVEQLPCSDDIDSIRLYDRPPFLQERGYAKYVAQVSTQREAVQSSRLMC